MTLRGALASAEMGRAPHSGGRRAAGRKFFAAAGYMLGTMSRPRHPAPRLVPPAALLLALLACMVAGQRGAMADHALRQDGLALFNVTVMTDHTTAPRLRRVLHKSESFSYDYRSDRQRFLRGRSAYNDLATYEVTSATISTRRDARRFMEQRGWERHTPPPPLHIAVPTPTPMPIPTPTPEPTPGPDRVVPASEGLSLGDRLIRQAEIFVRERKRLSDEIALGKPGSARPSDAEGLALRVKLLGQQKGIILTYFPSDDAMVSGTLTAIDDQTSTVLRTGRFDFEY